MSLVPAPYKAHYKSPVRSTKDAYGNRTTAYSDPVEFDVQWGAPGAMSDFAAPGREASKIEWTLSAPSPCPVTEHDRVIWAGEEYKVAGRPKDWTLGPWPNPAAAVIIELERVTG